MTPLGAVETATEAVEAAMEASMALTARAEGVAGDSGTVMANAQSVLDAEATANAAVVTAQNALNAAEAALSGVDDSTTAGEALKRALESAVERAQDQLDMATELAEGDDLKAAVVAVKGPDPDDERLPDDPGRPRHGRGDGDRQRNRS